MKSIVTMRHDWRMTFANIGRTLEGNPGRTTVWRMLKNFYHIVPEPIAVSVVLEPMWGNVFGVDCKYFNVGFSLVPAFFVVEECSLDGSAVAQGRQIENAEDRLRALSCRVRCALAASQHL